TEEAIKAATENFVGDILQVPPHYSAIRIGGERVYKKARKGEEVKIDPRPVAIYAFEITNCQLPEVSFRVTCSKGTYIRSLVRDFGELLGVGACLTSLRRTKIGDFSVDNAYDLQDFIEKHRVSKNVSN